MQPGEPAGTDAAFHDGSFRGDTLSRAALAVLGLFVLGACATAEKPPPGPAPKTAVRDAEILVLAGGRSHFFENRRPHCLAYVLDGDWEFAAPKAALRTTDRRRFVGVVWEKSKPCEGSGCGGRAERGRNAA